MTEATASTTRERQALSKERIVDAALRVAERDGLEQLTMRSLAAELDVTQMAAYYYVKNKDDLLNLVTDAVFEHVEIPTVDDGTWDVRLKLLCTRQFEEVRRFPGLTGFLPKAKLGPAQLRLFEALISIFDDAGLDEDDVMRAFAMVQTYLIGRFGLSDRLTGPASRQKMVRFLGQRSSQDAGAVLVEFALDTMIAGLRELGAA